MKNHKRILSLALALVMALALLPTAALAAGDFQTTDGVLVKYNGPGGDVVIPDSVTGIGRGAFQNCTSLTSITIPGSVTSIGSSAFSNCTSLTSVTIPGGVTSIGNWAFNYCTSLTSVTIPGSVTSIGDSAFKDCFDLTDIIIPSGVTSIGEGAFKDCRSLTSVVIPDSVTSIGEGAFEDCKSLTSVVIPDSVTSIGSSAFYGCTSLTSVTIQNGLTSIGQLVFAGCTSLTNVTIPPSVAEIVGFWFNSAFNHCASLTTVCGAEGSYAQLWAMDNGYTFQATLPPAATPGKTAYAATQNILVNGVPVEFQAYALKDENGNLTNYVKLRDVASVLNGSAAQFQVGWDGSVTITTQTAYTPNGSEMTTPYSGDRTYASAKSSDVSLNGRRESMQALLLKDAEGNGYTYFMLRDLGKALGFNVGWAADKGIFVETDKPYDTTN